MSQPKGYIHESTGLAKAIPGASPATHHAAFGLVVAMAIVTGYLLVRTYDLGAERVARHLGMTLLAIAPLPVVLWLSWHRPALPGQSLISASLFQDAVYFFLNLALRLSVIVGLMAGLRIFYGSHLSSLTIEAGEAWPPWLRFTASFLFLDFLGWLHHVIRHRVAFFWSFHTVHHSQEQMNYFTNARVHIVDTVIGILIISLPMSMVKLSPPAIVGFVLLMGWHRCVYHSNLRTNYGWLRYVLVTPQSHRIHHSTLPEHLNMNFGVNLSIWDQLFGTQYREYDEYPVTGIGDESFPHERSGRPRALAETLLAQFLYPFRVLRQRWATHKR